MEPCGSIFLLLPLNCGAWLWRHVVADAVDIGYLGQDAVGNLQQDRPFNLLDCCCHGVDGVDGADDDGPVV